MKKLASMFLALAIAAAVGCTEMEPGSAEAEPELGSAHAALELAGTTTWTARIVRPGETLPYSSQRYASPLGASVPASAYNRMMLGPATPLRIDRLHATLVTPVSADRTVKVLRQTSTGLWTIIHCTIPAGATSCTSTATPALPADALLLVGVTGGVAGDADTDVLVSWTFHAE